MSVQINISFEIHSIEKIHSKQEKLYLRDVLIQAANQFVIGEGLQDDVLCDFLGQKGYLAAYTVHPVLISGFHRWLPDVTQRWEKMARSILGEDCRPEVHCLE